MTKPWDRRPPSSAGNATPDEIWVEVGRALTAWELLEGELAEIFAICVAPLRGSPTLAAKRSYGLVLGAKVHIDMVGEAAEMFANQRIDGWSADPVKELLKRCSGFSGRRNDIAHGVVTRNDLGNELQTRAVARFPLSRSFSPDLSYYLLPAPYNARRTTAPPPAVPSPGGTASLADQFASLVSAQGPGDYKWDAAAVRYYADQFDQLRSTAAALRATHLQPPP
jgi:hypothetical protein